MRNETSVFVHKTPSGTLKFEDGQFVFNYTHDATEVVSVTMPIRSASWNSKALHPIFQMNMPEGALKEAIKEHFAKIERMDELGMLKLIGPYMLGRVKFEKIVEESQTLALEDILQSHKQNLFDELMERFAIRSGVSGVQPKLLLSAHNKTTMRFEHFIVKSWESSYPNLALNEYFCMRACQHANLPTPQFYMSEDYSMFIMKRFDIDEEGNYLGFEDMCVLTARGSQDKYEGSYEECARVIKDVVSPNQRREALKLFFKALVMNHLLKNGDAHLKNFGILYKKDFQDSALAPIYDVITTTLYIKNDIPALKMSGGKVWWKAKTYATFAKQTCQLAHKEYETILVECEHAIITTKEEMAHFKGDAPTMQFLQELGACWSQTIG